MATTTHFVALIHIPEICDAAIAVNFNVQQITAV